MTAPSECDDALAAAEAARALGAQMQVEGDRWKIAASQDAALSRVIDVHESGTVLRLLLPLLALREQPVRVVGSGSLRGRPNHHLVQVLQQLGVHVSGKGEKDSVPIVFSGGKLIGGEIRIDGSLSSQFISALLMACPALPHDTVLRVTGKKVVSQDYVQMTIQVLQRAGVQIIRRSPRLFRIPGNQRFRGLRWTIPSDYGLAAFLMAGAALTDSGVTLNGSLQDNIIQADGRIMGLLQKMGVSCVKTSRSIRLRGPFMLKGGRFSLKNCPDLLPVLAVLSLFARGRTRFTDIAHVRAKESDRITDLRRELCKVGAGVEETSDSLTIVPRREEEYNRNIRFDSHSDHRLAMAFSIAGLRLGAAVKNAQCVTKSYPGFFRDLSALGARLTIKK